MSNNPYIVISDGFNEKIFNDLSNEKDLEVHPEKKLSRENLISLGEKVNGLVVRSATIVDQNLINHLPNLNYVIRAGEGTDNIDKKYCSDKGIKVSNTPGANSNSAAEHAVALMMTLLRKTHHAHASSANASPVIVRYDAHPGAVATGATASKRTVYAWTSGNISKALVPEKR